MNIVENQTRFIGISKEVNLVERKSESLNNQTQPFTMGDLAMSSVSPLTFTWTKAHRHQVVINERPINYFELGIDFNCLVMEEGATYTLLLDRHKPQESRNSIGKLKKTRYAHETVADAVINERFSELPITSATGQFFDFTPYNYFFDGYQRPRGFSNRRGRTRGLGSNGEISSINYITRFVNLGFRIRVEKNGVTTETGILGTIAMCSQYLSNGGGGNQNTIAYARPNS